MVTLPGGTTLAGAVRSGLDLLATILVVAVAGALLVRILAAPPPARAERIAPSTAAGVRPEPPLPSQPISLDGAAVIGSSTAPVAIIGFSDFQCPFCRVFAQTHWPNIKRALVDSGQVRFAFRHLPLDSLHPQARRIAVGAECARRQERFSPYHDLLFENQAVLAKADLTSLASSVGVDRRSFASCLDAPDAAAVVTSDSAGASALAVTGTPTFLVGRVDSDGRVKVLRRLVGARDVEAFKAAVEEARRNP